MDGGARGLIFVEKTWRHGKGFGIAFGVALLVMAALVPSRPGLVPGLQPASTMMSSGM